MKIFQNSFVLLIKMPASSIYFFQSHPKETITFHFQQSSYLGFLMKQIGYNSHSFISVFTLHTLKVIHSTRSVSIHYFMGKYCEILWTQASLFIYIGIIFVLDQLWALCVMLHKQCAYMFYMFFWQI